MNPEEEGSTEALRAEDALKRIGWAASGLSVEAFRDLAKAMSETGDIFNAVMARFPETDLSANAEDGLEAILAQIRKAQDKKKAASEWLTQISNGIAAITKETED